MLFRRQTRSPARMLTGLAHGFSLVVFIACVILMLAPADATAQNRSNDPADTSASTSLLTQWASDAEALHTALTTLKADIAAAPARPVSLPEALRTDLIGFAVSAQRLASQHDAGGGSKDLSCIYRGLSEEVGVQLDAIASAKGASAPALRALTRLEKAAADAALIAQAEAARTGSAPSPKPGSCPHA
jgi:hypothetical protein